MFILASSVCKSLQCLISTLTQGGGGGHLFRLTYSVVLWGGRNTANKYHWHAWAVLSVGCARSVLATLGLPLLTACVLSLSTLLRLQIALQGNCLKLALGCVHFPGLSRSGSGSWVLHKGTDLVGLRFVPFLGLSSSGNQVLGNFTLPAGQCVLSPPPSQLLSFLGAQWECHLRCAMCLLWGADLWL